MLSFCKVKYLRKYLNISSLRKYSMQFSIVSQTRLSVNHTSSVLSPSKCALRFMPVCPPVSRSHSAKSWLLNSRSNVIVDDDDVSISDYFYIKRNARHTTRSRMTIAKSRMNKGGIMSEIPVEDNVSQDLQLPVGENLLVRLQVLFEMTHQEAVDIVQDSKLFLIADDLIHETVFVLKSHNITKEQLKRIPWILLQTSDELKCKMNILTGPCLFNTYSDGLGFCYFSPKKIRWLQEMFKREEKDFSPHNNRIYFLADKLMVPVDQLTEKILAVPELLTVKLDRVKLLIDVLNKYNIQREHILNDLRALLSKPEIFERRLEEIFAAGYKNPKLWLCRFSLTRLQRYLNKSSFEREILNEWSSVEEYLIKKLGCSSNDLNILRIKDNVLVRRVPIQKMAKLVDLLLSEGYSTNQILCNLPIAIYSLRRIKKRIQHLKELGITTIMLPVFRMPDKKFESYCASIQDKKK